jgi:two-component system sensor histidine kinase CpxA
MPLYLRILLLFLLNVTVLFGALGWIAHRQMQSGLQSFLGTMVGARLQNAAEEIHSSLTNEPAARWPEILARFEKDHRVQAGLFRLPDVPLAGSVKVYPPEVAEGLFPRMGTRERGPGNREPGFGPPVDRPSAPPAMRRIPANSPTAAGGRDFPKGLIRTGQPPRYWAVAALPPMPTERRGRQDRLIFAVSTESVLTCPLLFDLRPWLLGITAALGVSCLIWFPFVRAITSMLRETTQATREMAAGKLSVRIRENRRDEIGQLAASVNQMAGQLQGFVDGQRRFTRDIAHELCSPVSRMQAAVGVLENATLDERGRRYAEALDRELQHMSHLVQELLQFARDTHPHTAGLCAVVLDPLVQTVIDRECGAEPDPRLTVQVPNDLIVTADPALLARALSNIVRNALRYAGPQATIAISATRSAPDRIRIVVADDGPGVIAEALPRLFEAFYRPDEARSPGHGGAGLGLAIVKHAVQACGGTVSASAAEPHGLVVAIVLPAGDAAC